MLAPKVYLSKRGKQESSGSPNDDDTENALQTGVTYIWSRLKTKHEILGDEQNLEHAVHLKPTASMKVHVDRDINEFFTTFHRVRQLIPAK